MAKARHVVERLSAQGHRQTKARTAIVALLVRTKNPLPIVEIGERLAGLAIRVNKTTLYRELQFLVAQDIAREIDFGEGKKRYEFASAAHHHHVVCTRCQRVEDVVFPDDLLTHETAAAQQTGYRIQSHSLEFFGLCTQCR